MKKKCIQINHLATLNICVKPKAKILQIHWFYLVNYFK